MWRLATILITTAAVLTSCGLHIAHLLQSQQACEMTYMYAAYNVVNLPVEGQARKGYAAAAASPPLPRSNWVKEIDDAASRVTSAWEGLGRTNYRLWRYTGDDNPAQRQGSGLALPVLFIPGNGGSHEMVRSLGSETARRFSRLGVRAVDPVAVDWYMLDLEGEWSAFDGGILEAQVQFALAALRHIATTHGIISRSNNTMSCTGRDPNAKAMPCSDANQRLLQQHPGLVVVAHSMGGVVAADALARAVDDPELGPSVAALLVTLGSPHTRAPVPGYPSVEAFYTQAAARPRPVVPMVSIGGGAADMQVATALTDPEGMAPKGLWRWFVLPAMPGGWCPSRHNGLVWCNQLVVALGQVLMDMAQDVLPSLEAARKASSAAAPAALPRQHGSGIVNGLAAWAAAKGFDPTLITQGAYPDDAPEQQPVERPWDWALRRVDQHLAHPAQSFLPAALAAIASPSQPQLQRGLQAGDAERVEGDSSADGEPKSGPDVQDDVVENRAEEGEGGPGLLFRLAKRALAPTTVGGAACGGANLAWYLQYAKPQLVKSHRNAQQALLRLLPADVEDVHSVGRMFTWELDGKRASGQHLKENAPLGWTAVISGLQPCNGFRAWLSVRVDYQSTAGSSIDDTSVPAGDGGDSRESLEAEARRALRAPARTVRHDVEVTGLAAPLPAVSAQGGWKTRNRGEWAEIGQGRDYQSRAGWLLMLPHSLVLPLLEPTGAPLLQGRRRSGEKDSGDHGLKPIVTLLLTLWLAEPSHKPAFQVIAESFAPMSKGAKAGPEPLQPGLPLPKVAWTHLGRDLHEKRMSLWRSSSAPPQQRQLVVPLGVPYVTHASYDLHGTIAGFVRWLGLYRYAAVRIVRLGVEPLSAALDQAGAGQGSSRGEGCLLPTVLLVSNGSTGGSRMASLLQISTNRTLHSLEPCAVDLRGCSAVTAVLDPACNYHVDLVPYAAERLSALLLAHVGRLWLGAQLAALCAVAAVTAETVAGSRSPTFIRRPNCWWPFVAWFPLPWEALTVLQGALVHRTTLELLLTTAFVASFATAVVPRGGLPTAPDFPGDLGSSNSSATNSPTSSTWNGTIANGNRADLLTHIRSRAALAWPAVRQMARVAGLCPQPNTHDCGWGASSAGLIAPLVTLAPFIWRSPVSVLALLLYLAPSPSGPAGEILSVMDWAAMLASVMLLTWLLAVLLQVAVAAAVLLNTGIWALLQMPFEMLLSPWRFVRGLLFGSTTDGGDGNAATAAGAAAGGKLAALRRWAFSLVPLVALAALGGEPSAIPGAALLVSVWNLAMSLSAARAKLQMLATSGVASASAWQQLKWRRRLAWLLFYAAYGMCAAPATAAALRRLGRPAALQMLSSALVEMLDLVLRQLLEGRGFVMLQLGLQWAKEAAVSAITEMSLMRTENGVELLPKAARALEWGLSQLREGRAADVIQMGLRWLLTGAATVAVNLQLTVARLSSLAAGAGFVLAAAHCGTMAWQAAGGPTEAERPWLYHEVLSSCRMAASMPVAAGCLLLALAWWLGAMEAAHVAAAAVATTQLLLQQR